MAALQPSDDADGVIRQLRKESGASLYSEPDFRALFEGIPGLFLVLMPDVPTFTIVAASDAYLQAFKRFRKELLGRPVVEAFARGSDPVDLETLLRVSGSFERAVSTCQPETMPPLQYNVPILESEGGGFEERYWSTVNSPVLGANGRVSYIIQRVEDVTATYRAEQALRGSEARLRLATEAAELGIWVWHIAEDRMTWENDRLYEMFGLPHSGEPINASRFMNDFAYSEDAPQFEQAIAKTLQTGARFHYLGRFHHGSGDLRWTELIGHLHHAPDGTPARVVGTAADVTERKRAEQRDALLVRLDDAVRPLTDPKEITHVAVRLVGDHLQVDAATYSTVEPDGETFDILGDYSRAGDRSTVGRYKLAMFGPALGEAMRTNLPYVVDDVETDVRTMNVQTAYREIGIRANAAVPLFKGQLLTGALGIHQLTPRRWRLDEIDLLRQVANRCWESLERARITHELREREQRYRFLAESIPQMVWTANPTGTLDYINRQGIEYFGVDQERLLGVGWLAMLHPEDQKHAVESWSSSLTSGKQYETTFRLQRANDSNWHWHLVRALPLHGEAGEILQWFGTCTDIQNQKAIETDLMAANRQLEEFAYVASHDLQEPLRMVNIYTQLLLRRFVGDQPEAQKYGGLVRQGVQRMEALLRDLLAFSRAGHREDQINAVDLGASLKEALMVLHSELEESGAIIKAGPLPTLRGDTQLTHVFQNLLSNALKYCKKDEPPAIHITSEPDGNGWVISVRDNGIGFEPKYAEQIFGLFKRLHKDEYPGTGLGLAICQRIVERYGGRMWAEGQPGIGAAIHFWLPGNGGE